MNNLVFSKLFEEEEEFDDMYSDSGIDGLVDSGEISDIEEAFMRGYLSSI